MSTIAVEPCSEATPLTSSRQDDPGISLEAESPVETGEESKMLDDRTSAVSNSNERDDSNVEAAKEEDSFDNTPMGKLEVLSDLIFGILLPTWDFISDVLMAVWLINSDHPIFGTSMLVPVLLSTIFVLVQWYRSLKHRWYHHVPSLILVILNVWPQYQLMKILCSCTWDSKKKREKKTEYLKTVGFLGMLQPIAMDVSLYL